MSKPLSYQTDLSGINPDNLVTKEYQTVITQRNDNRLIVPNATPFFRNNLKIINWPSGKVLVENKDYYLGYRYREMETPGQDPFFGAIVITNLGLGGAFELQYQTVGGNYVKPQPQLLEYLTNYLTNPRITDWSKVINRSPSYPVKEHTYSHEDHVNLDGVKGGIDRVREAIENWHAAVGDETFTALTNRLNNLEALMVASGLANHQHRKDDPHNVTYTQAGALGANQAAKDTIKAFNLTLREFVQYCYDNGVTQNDLDTLLPRASNHRLMQKLVLPTTSHVRSQDGNPTINIANSLLNVIASGELLLQADRDLNGNGQVQLGGGNNMLTIASAGTALNDDGLRYNGSVVIHEGNSARLLTAISDAVYYISVDDGSNTLASGNGSAGDPLRVDGNIPKATTSVKGEGTLKNETSSNSTDPVTANQLEAQSTRLADKLPINVKVNGMNVRDNPTITKATIGLSEVDNTSDASKPISGPQEDLLDQYVGSHSHDSNVIYIPLASESEAGYGAFRTQGSSYSTEDGELASIKEVSDLYDDGQEFLADTLGGVPADLLPVISYGEPDYLPIPATGYYGGSGWGGDNYAAMLEPGNRIIALRNGRDWFESAIYYFRVDYNDSMQLVSATPLTTRYEPKLPAGERLTRIVASCDTAMVAVSETGKRFLVEFNGTMEANKHECTEILGDYWKMVDGGDRYYFVLGDISSSYGLRIRVKSVLKSDLGFGRVVDTGDNYHTLTGNRRNGTVTTAQDWYYIGAQRRVSEDTSDAMVVVDDDFGYSGSVRHATQNILLGYQDGKIRVYLYQRPYYSKATGSVYGGTWDISFTIDTRDNFKVVCDYTPDFPIRITSAGGFTFGNLKVKDGSAYPGGDPNQVSFGNPLGPGMEIYNRNYGTHSQPYLYVRAAKDPNLTWYESLNKEVRGTGIGFNAEFLGDTSGGVGFSIRQGLILSKNRFAFRTYNGSFYADIDPDNLYEADADAGRTHGFGYTGNITQFDEADLYMLSRIPLTCTGNMTYDGKVPAGEVMRGATWWAADQECSWEWDGTFSGTATIAASVFNSLKSTCKAAAQAIDGNVLVSDTLYVHTHTISAVPCFAVYTMQLLLPDGSKRSRHFYFRTDFNSRQNPTSITMTPVMLYEAIRYTQATGLGVSEGTHMGWQIAPYGSNRYMVTLNTAAIVPHVGNSGCPIIAFIYNTSNNTMENIGNYTAHSYGTFGVKIVPSKGVYYIREDSSGTAVYATDYYRDTYPSPVTGADAVIYSTVAVGNWLFFITDDIDVYAKGVRTTLSPANFDVREVTADYRNQKFYLYHSHSDGESQGYALNTTKSSNSDDLTWIGLIETDDNGITSVSVWPSLRWGELKELNEHIADRGAHGYGGVNKSDFNLDLIENKEATDVLDAPTWEEVFDTWYRFSHYESSATVPALPDELNEWSYDSVLDTVSCTINSASWIGFVSPGGYSDYEFDTYISSVGSDDDMIGVVIAFEIDENGGEHSIIAYRILESQHTAGGDTAVIKHRYTSPDNDVTTNILYTYIGTPLPFGWSQVGRSRIRVLRVGDVYTVEFYSFELVESQQLDTPIATVEVDLDDAPTMEIFKGSSRFGYVCMSQDRSTWENIVRPDVDNRSYYATNHLLASAYEDFGSGTLATLDIELTGLSGNTSLKSEIIDLTDYDEFLRLPPRREYKAEVIGINFPGGIFSRAECIVSATDMQNSRIVVKHAGTGSYTGATVKVRVLSIATND